MKTFRETGLGQTKRYDENVAKDQGFFVQEQEDDWRCVQDQEDDCVQDQDKRVFKSSTHTKCSKMSS